MEGSAAALSGHLVNAFEQSQQEQIRATGPFGQPLPFFPTETNVVEAGNMSFNSSMQGGALRPHTSAAEASSSTARYAGGMTTDSQFNIQALQHKLNQKLGPEYLSTRPGGGGTKLTYTAGWQIINLANEVFGFNGWSTNVVDLTTDYIDEKNGRYSVGVTSIVRVTLRDGAYHEDIGYGQGDNQPNKGQALDKAKKEAVTDGMKRALRHFGNVVGNCLYDKSYTDRVAKMKPKVPKEQYDDNTLYHSEKYASTSNQPSTSARPSPHANSSGQQTRPPVPPPRQHHPHQPGGSSTRPPISTGAQPNGSSSNGINAQRLQSISGKAPQAPTVANARDMRPPAPAPKPDPMPMSDDNFFDGDDDFADLVSGLEGVGAPIGDDEGRPLHEDETPLHEDTSPEPEGDARRVEAPAPKPEPQQQPQRPPLAAQTRRSSDQERAARLQAIERALQEGAPAVAASIQQQQAAKEETPVKTERGAPISREQVAQRRGSDPLKREQERQARLKIIQEAMSEKAAASRAGNQDRGQHARNSSGSTSMSSGSRSSSTGVGGFRPAQQQQQQPQTTGIKRGADAMSSHNQMNRRPAPGVGMGLNQQARQPLGTLEFSGEPDAKRARY